MRTLKAALAASEKTRKRAETAPRTVNDTQQPSGEKVVRAEGGPGTVIDTQQQLQEENVLGTVVDTHQQWGGTVRGTVTDTRQQWGEENEPGTANDTPTCGGIGRVESQRGRTWFPILLGVLCGMIVFVLLAAIESPALYRLSVLIFNETSPKALFAIPAYYCIHRTVLLVLAAAGGLIGVLCSRWPKVRAVVFLLTILLVIAVLAAIGFH
jgi:hypothetical protein